MKELGVFIFFYGSLGFVKSLLDEGTILHVENSISIAFKFRVVGNHHARSGKRLAISPWTNSINV